MTDADKDEWKQFAEDVAACAFNVVTALAPDRETCATLKRTCLQTQAKILRGLLTVVESQLKQTAPAEPRRAEKIAID